jgi:short-subunit dehydrogenase
MSAFIQGASKGIGFSLAKEILKKTSLQVICSGRNQDDFKENLSV